MIDLQQLNQRRAILADLPDIIRLLADDDMNQTNDHYNSATAGIYQQAFVTIDQDPQHYLMVIDYQKQLIGTCHLTLLPSLSFQGELQLQIENVKVSSRYRNQGVGHYIAFAL